MKPRYLIVDTETNGFMCKGFGHEQQVSRFTGRILQLAWALYDRHGTLISQSSYYIQPYQYKVGATEVHGITEQTLYQGIPFKDAYAIFKRDFDQVQIILGHNIKFDESVLINELNIYGLHDLIDEFNDKYWICTQQISKQIYGGKKSNLGNIYQIVFGKDASKQHDAKYDVLNLGDIVTYWITHQIINRNFQKVYQSTIETYQLNNEDTSELNNHKKK